MAAPIVQARAGARRVLPGPALAAAAGNRARGSSVLLLGDAVAAILFAAGVAGGVAAVARGLPAWPWALLMGLAGFARAACLWGSLRLGSGAAAIAKSTLRRTAARAALRRPAGSGSVGALLGAVVDEVEAIDGYIARFLPARRAAAIAPMIVLGAIAFASPVAALILLGTLIPFIGAMILAGGAAADQSRRQFDALSRLSGLFADRVRGLPVILAFHGESREAERLGHVAREVAARTMRVLRVAFLSSASLEFFAALSVALVAVYAGFALLGQLPFHAPERLDLVRAFFVLALAPEFYAPMRRLAAAYHDRQAAETASARLAALDAAAMPPVREGLAVVAAPAIAFDHITIRYPGEERDAVGDLSIDIRPGEIVALVGPSGSGKSSLLHLLLGLVPAQEGQVTIDGKPLLEIGSVAPFAAWAGQAPLMLAGSIADNIRLGRADAAPAEVAAVAAAVGLEDALARRVGGLEERLDHRGGGLSGGERRRIGVARALLKDAPLLLLDEPTAHLDHAAEAALIAVIARACVGRTVIVATHSGALAALADRIVDLGGVA
ncbi:MAG: thiol reductant ABC exporter subunit CydD [Pseudomonadota bacterium]